jgi:hypothetical protein
MFVIAFMGQIRHGIVALAVAIGIDVIEFIQIVACPCRPHLFLTIAVEGSTTYIIFQKCGR